MGGLRKTWSWHRVAVLMLATIYDMNGANPKCEWFTTDLSWGWRTPTSAPSNSITKVLNHWIGGGSDHIKTSKLGILNVLEGTCNQPSGDMNFRGTCYPIQKTERIQQKHPKYPSKIRKRRKHQPCSLPNGGVLKCGYHHFRKPPKAAKPLEHPWTKAPVGHWPTPNSACGCGPHQVSLEKGPQHGTYIQA